MDTGVEWAILKAILKNLNNYFIIGIIIMKVFMWVLLLSIPLLVLKYVLIPYGLPSEIISSCGSQLCGFGAFYSIYLGDN
jgi:hypothetical protein